MATSAEILDAARNAAAAGDRAGAGKLMGAYKDVLAKEQAAQAPAAAPAQAAAPAAAGPVPLAQRMAQVDQIIKTGAPLPPALARDKEVLAALTQRAAQKENGMPGDAGFSQEENAQVGLDTASGVKEGVMSLWGGIKQAYGGAKDAFDLLVSGKPFDKDVAIRLPNGKLIRREQGKLETSSQFQATAQELLDAQMRRAEALEGGATDTGRNTMAGITQYGTLAVAPEAALPRATTAIGGVLKNSVAGGIGGGLTFNADPNGKDALIGAGAGPVLGLPFSLAPAVKNWVGRGFARAVKEGRSAARLINAQKVFKKTGFDLAQKTGVPELTSMQRAAYNRLSVNKFADQTDNFIEEAVDALRQPLKPGQELADDWVAARARADTNLSNMKRTASTNYQAGFDEAARIANGVPGGNRVPVDNLRSEFDRVVTEAQDALANGGGNKLPGDFTDALEGTLFDVQKGQRGRPTDMTVEEVSRALKGLTKLQASTDPVTKMYATRLRAAFEDDLAQLEQKGGFEADDAIKTLIQTRQEYSRAMGAADAIGTSQAYKLLGVNGEDVHPSDIIERLHTFNPAKQVEIRKYLEQHSPDLLTSLKQEVMNNIKTKAQTIRAAADSQQSLDQLLDTMFDTKGGYNMRTLGIWNPEEVKRIESIADGLRIVANGRPVAGRGAGTSTKLEDIAPNVVSQSGIFIARQAARLFTGNNLSKFLFDPEVYEIMQKFNRSTTGSASNLALRAALLDKITTSNQEAKVVRAPEGQQ